MHICIYIMYTYTHTHIQFGAVDKKKQPSPFRRIMPAGGPPLPSQFWFHPMTISSPPSAMGKWVMYTYIHTYKHTYIHTYTHRRMGTYIHNTQMCLHSITATCRCSRLGLYSKITVLKGTRRPVEYDCTHARTHACIYVEIPMYVYAYHAYIHTCMSAYAQSRSHGQKHGPKNMECRVLQNRYRQVGHVPD